MCTNCVITEETASTKYFFFCCCYSFTPKVSMEGTSPTTLSVNSTDAGGETVDLDNLYPALAECFGIVVLGYLAAKFGLVSEVESRGLSTFAGSFALPALVFGSLCSLDLGCVSWSFLGAILVAKAALFAVVLVGTLLVVRPFDPARAGLFAIFVTQSNDFALGFPILQAVYGKTHPEIPMYLYLMAPISLIILNPVGFVLMEMGTQSHSEEEGMAVTGRVRAINVLKSVASNPIIFMTVAGIIGNFVFSQTLPDVLDRLLTTLGASFSACALFLLGLRMVGKRGSGTDSKSSRVSALLVPAVLILLKTVALPLVAREAVNTIGAGEEGGGGHNSTVAGRENKTEVFSDFAFLYGTFPTAPSVFVYATRYEVEVDMTAAAMVACTFVAAPIMFVSARLLSLTNVNPADYIDELDGFLLDISILGVSAAAWTLLVFAATKRYTRVPHFMTLALVISQVRAWMQRTSFFLIDFIALLLYTCRYLNST